MALKTVGTVAVEYFGSGIGRFGIRVKGLEHGSNGVASHPHHACTNVSGYHKPSSFASNQRPGVSGYIPAGYVP